MFSAPLKRSLRSQGENINVNLALPKLPYALQHGYEDDVRGRVVEQYLKPWERQRSYQWVGLMGVAFCKKFYTYTDETIFMKLLLDIKDNKTAFIIELLDSFKFVKAKPLTPYKAEVLEGVQQAVHEMKLIKKGKLQGTLAQTLLDEL